MTSVFRKSGLLILIASACLISACATLIGSRDVEIPLSSLQQGIAKRFPFNNRYLDLLDIMVSNPQVSLLPQTNRIATQFDIVIAPPFLNKAWKGNFALSGMPQFDPAQNAVLLAEPRVDTFKVDGLDNRYAAQMTKLGNLLADQLLRDTPLYRFRPEDLQYAGSRFTLSKITTRADRLVVTFEPAK